MGTLDEPSYVRAIAVRGAGRMDAARGCGAEPLSAALVIPVGPGEREIARLADTLDSVWAHEPAVRLVVLADDTTGGRDLLGTLPVPPAWCSVRSILNPRLGRGDGIMGGMAVGVVAALGAVAEAGGASITLKIDTDTLVIAPFAARLAAYFVGTTPVGLVGQHKVGVNIDPAHRVRLRGMKRPFRLSHHGLIFGRSLCSALWGRHARIRRHILAARSHGTELGEHCLGGGYALSRRALDALDGGGLLRNPLDWVDAWTTEDVAVAVLVGAAGFSQADLTGFGEPFGVEYKGLPFLPDQLLARDHAVIHSVKDDRRISEAEVRAYFAERRARRA